MNLLIRVIIILIFPAFFIANCYSQEKPIGSWNSFLPYNHTFGMSSEGNNLYVISEGGFFIYENPPWDAKITYSKSNGMSDVGIKCISYDALTSSVILVYANGNIDIYKDKTFYNIADFKIKSITGIKEIYNVYCENGFAYISSSIGVLVVDIKKRNINETYQFYINNQIAPIKGFVSLNNSYYAITQSGLYKASKFSPDLQNFQVWEHIDSTASYNYVAINNNVLYLSADQTVYTYKNGVINSVYNSNFTINHIDTGTNCLFICEKDISNYVGYVRKLDTNFKTIDTIKSGGYPNQVLQLTNNSIWVTNELENLAKWEYHKLNTYTPEGPGDISNFDLYVNNGNLWIAHGGYSDTYRPFSNGRGLSNYKEGKWNQYQDWLYPLFSDTIADFVSVLVDESDGTMYAGSFGEYSRGGLFELKADGTGSIIKYDVFERSVASGGCELSGLALDNNNNLWVSTYTSPHELHVKEKSTGNWYNYIVSFKRDKPNNAGPLVIDDFGQVWYVCLYGTGAMVYSTNGTLADASDDKFYHLSSGVGSGNLPSNNVFSIAKDKTGNIWIGTDNGIGIIYQPSTCINDRCDATIPIVQYDQYAGYLFAGEKVRSIAVDGANRKWVGTDNGVWLLSADASQIIYRFTKENSPLPSNQIQKVAIDKATGDVYFGTDQGLVSYRSTATEGGDTNHNVLIFPNPVLGNYNGTIAIKGLVGNADVRITDIDGQLVYHTTAFGGQAIWNGMDYTGHRPQSGVYLVFVTNSDNSNSGTQTFVGKIVFIQGSSKN